MYRRARDIAAASFAVIALTALALSAPASAQQGLESDPVRRSAGYMGAEALVKAESYELAMEKLNELAEEEPQNADVFTLLGFSARESEDLPAAEAAYARALELDPEHRQALEQQGEMYLTLDEPDKAQANRERLVELCPDGCDELASLDAAFKSWDDDPGASDPESE